MHYGERECCCEHRPGRHGWSGHGWSGHGRRDGAYGCSGHGARHSFVRRFRTRQEVIEELERYLSDLKAEAEAVEERLAQLKV